MSIQALFLNDITLRASYRVNRYVGPYVLASHLEKQGIESLVIDWFTDIPNFFSYLRKFLSPEIKVIGISSTFLTQPLSPLLNEDLKKPLRTDQARSYFEGYLWFNQKDDLEKWMRSLRSLLNEFNPECKIILGGAKGLHIWRNHQPDDPFRHFDYIVTGAGENLISEIISGSEEELNSVSLKKNELKFLQGKALNEGTLCPSIKWNKKWALQYGESLPIEISRGCKYNCKFCHYDKRGSVKKSTRSLRNEMIANYEEYGVTGYHFSDDCFNDTRNKVDELCNMFLSLPFKIDWISYARIDVAARFPETFDLMVNSGCRGVWLGLESFNREASLKSGKGVPPDEVKETLLRMRKNHKANCLIAASFITGLPYETQESQLDTLDWLLNNDVLDFASFGVLGILPYDSSMDNKAMDYAEYTRNPQKNGFQKVSWDPYYWEHATMNSETAKQLADHCQKQWLLQKGQPYFKFIWAYPMFRSYGFSHEEIIAMTRNPENSNNWRVETEKRKRAWDDRYWSALAKFQESNRQREFGSVLTCSP
ncbi:MAG: radical SAM protein [Pseudobdellovibrionaceae bacterium]